MTPPRTKKELASAIAEELGLTAVMTKQVIDRLFHHLRKAIVAHGHVEMRNFGVFDLKDMAPRLARNMKTNEPIEVPAKTVVAFKASKQWDIPYRG